MQPVLSTDCITECAGGDISRVFKLIQHVKNIFPLNHASDEDHKLFLKAVPSWDKFCGMTDLLVYSLSEVAEWLPR